MTLALFLKSFSENAFYFSLAHLVLALLGVSFDAYPPLLLLSLALALSRTLAARSPRLRYLPLVLLPVCFAFTHSLPAAGAVALPALFTAFSVHRQLFEPQYGDCVDAFRRSLRILLIFPAAALFGAGRAVLLPVLPLLTVFLAGSVLLLRMLRHKEETLRQPRFVAINTALVCAVLALGALFSIPAVLSWLASGAALLYRILIVPPLMCLSYLGTGIAWVLLQLLTFLISLLSKSPNPPAVNEIAQITDQLGETIVREPSALMRNLSVTVFLLAAVLLAVLYLKRRLGRLRKAAPQRGVVETRTQAQPFASRRPVRELFAPRNARRAVRWYYRRFLGLYQTRGGALRPSYDSADVAKGAYSYFAPEPVDELRAVYLDARYGEAEIPRQAAEQAARCYQTLKHNTKEEL